MTYLSLGDKYVRKFISSSMPALMITLGQRSLTGGQIFKKVDQKLEKNILAYCCLKSTKFHKKTPFCTIVGGLYSFEALLLLIM